MVARFYRTEGKRVEKNSLLNQHSMLAKKYRLKGRSVLEEVKKKGSLYQTDSFGVLVLKREDDEPSRFAFIVSTKISKIAVKRNGVKRKLREAVKKRIKKVNNGYDVVFLAKKTTLDKNNIELEKEVKEVFQDSGLAQ